MSHALTLGYIIVSEHAGVTPNPTGSSSGALDAVREEDIQPSLVAPSDYDDVTPRIANDSA